MHENKDETATRKGAWWGAAAGAAVGIIFPPSILVGIPAPLHQDLVDRSVCRGWRPTG